MKLGYYPGCSLNGTAKEFDISLKEVMTRLGVELTEVPDWSCCGASSAHSANHLLSVLLPARNLILAKKSGMNEVAAPCAACFSRLTAAQNEMRLDEKVRTKVEDIIEEKYQGSVEVLNLMQLFQKIGLDKLKEEKKIDLKGLKAACYYGCLLVRPNDVLNFDDEENPTSMEEILRSIGVTPVEWNFKTECCGASHSIARLDIVEKLSKKILDDAIKNGADIIVTACPMCHSNLDMRQTNIKKHNPEQKEIPVLYLSQLAGLAIGIDPSKLGLNLHFINPLPLLKQKIAKEEAAV